MVGAVEPFNRSQEDEIYNVPEKWYVREKWLEYTTERKQKNNRKYIRFLTLTSVKGYDVEFLRDNGLLSCTETGYDFKSVAFCEIDNERYVRIRNRLPGARDHLGSYEDLVWAGRPGFGRKAERWFPFDVINLDIPRSGFSQRSRVMAAILKTFMIQKFRQQSFTLFLTLPAVPSGDDEVRKKQLLRCLKVNLRNNEFKERFFKKFPKGKFSHYHKFLLVAVPKLIINFGQSENFDVQCREKLTYVGERSRTKMVSFIFDCEYHGLTADYGGEAPTPVLGGLYPTRVLEEIEKDCVDINRKLRNPEMRAKYRRYVRQHVN